MKPQTNVVRRTTIKFPQNLLDNPNLFNAKVKVTDDSIVLSLLSDNNLEVWKYTHSKKSWNMFKIIQRKEQDESI